MYFGAEVHCCQDGVSAVCCTSTRRRPVSALARQGFAASRDMLRTCDLLHALAVAEALS